MDCPKCSKQAWRIWLIQGGLCDSCLVHAYPLEEAVKNAEARLRREVRKAYYFQRQKEKAIQSKNQAR